MQKFFWLYIILAKYYISNSNKGDDLDENELDFHNDLDITTIKSDKINVQDYYKTKLLIDAYIY